MDNLPRNLVYEILIWLPATTLGNTARHVCRLWRSIIADPCFVDHHYTRWVSKEDVKTLLFLRDKSDYSRGFVMYTADGRLETIRPTHKLPQDLSSSYTRNILVCNGLVLYICMWNNKFLHFYVYNPIIDVSITLPPMELTFKEGEYSTSGFGYDSIKKDYKVVVLFNNRTKYEDDHKLYLYCCTINDGTKKSGTKDCYCWREVGYLDNEEVYGYEGLFVGGKLYWFLGPLIYDANILSFDLNSESFKTETFSNSDNPEILSCKLLGELSGEMLCVYVSYNIEESGSNRTSVWVKREGLESENSDWVEVSDMSNNIRFLGDYRGFWKDDLFVYVEGNSYVVVNKRSEIVHCIDNFGGSFLSRFIPNLHLLSSTEDQ